MKYLHISFLVAAIAVGGYFTVEEALNHQWLGAASWLLATVLAVTGWFCLWLQVEWIWAKPLGSFLVLLSAAAVFAGNKFFSDDWNAAYAEAIESVQQIQGSCTQQQYLPTDDVQRLITACAGQSNINAVNATIQLQKGVYFPPAASLADGVNEHMNPPPKDHCAAAVQNIVKKCPNAFPFMSEKSKQLLLGTH